MAPVCGPAVTSASRAENTLVAPAGKIRARRTARRQGVRLILQDQPSRAGRDEISGEDGSGERLQIEAARIRNAGTLGRSVPLTRLFDFLLARSLDGQTPKEVEVAQEVFGKDADFDMGADASVRVYIHRLRRRLEAFYRAAPAQGDRLFIPLGEYRLAIADGSAGPADEAPAVDPALPAPPVATGMAKSRRPWIAALLALLLVNAGGWLLLTRSSGPAAALSALANTPLWSPLAQSDRPTLVVVGDYYIFGEAPESTEVTRLIREFSINSREDLDQYLMRNPAQMGRLVDLDLHYLPVAAASALGALMPLVSRVAGGQTARPRVITMSQLSPDLLKSADIVYVGYLSGLGLLREAVFDASNFSVGTSYDELVDDATGTRYVSDWSEFQDGRSPRRDYGYIASLQGPSGNRILIIAGTRDAALAQMAENAVNPAQIGQIVGRAGGTSIEALYEVRTLGNTSFGSRLVKAAALRRPGSGAAGPGETGPFPDTAPKEP
ncbi:MAG: helix-turn-helix protein [Sphingomonas bacterium]|nr:helix-turn-helix protein [Sphingomonas bacterium]